jgi:hypothetical protein
MCVLVPSGYLQGARAWRRAPNPSVSQWFRTASWRGHVATSTATGHPVFHPRQEADEPAPDDLEIVDDREADGVTGRRVHV